jgi:hypothetical protein
MALRSTQPQTEMSNRNLSGGGVEGGHVGLTALPPSVSRLSRQNLGASTSHPHGPLRPVTGIALPLYLMMETDPVSKTCYSI